MRKQIMKKINEKLYNMEAVGKVDLTIQDDINELKVFLRQLKDKWLEERNADSYYFYQGLHNIELMLNKMKERFQTAQENHDNPQIAKDSIALFTVVDELLSLTESDKINDKTVDMVLYKTQELRDTAFHQNLIEPLKVDEDLLDKDLVRYQFHTVMENLDIPREQQIVVDKETEDSN